MNPSYLGLSEKLCPKFGRKRSVDREKLNLLRTNGVGVTEIAKQMGLARSTVYKVIKEKVAVGCYIEGLSGNPHLRRSASASGAH